MARVTVKNDGSTFEVPDGDRLLPYLWEHSSFPQGCDDGSTAICACVVLRGEENLSPKTHIEIVTLANARSPNSSRNRLACQIWVMRGEVVIEY